jgi:putative transposase
VLGSTWQRCRVHWMRNAQAYVTKGQQNMVSAALRQAFIQADHQSSSQTMRHVADQLRGKWPKLGTFIDESVAVTMNIGPFVLANSGPPSGVTPVTA